MAVQAQYPSNILLLNRGDQERKNMLGGGGDYTLQPQADEFIHQSQFFYGSGAGVIPRKRGREAVAGVTEAPVNLFQLQSHRSPPPAVVNLAQLQNQQPSMVSTGLRLALEGQHQQQQQHQHHQQQIGVFLPSSLLSSSLSEDLSAQIKQHKDEIDQFLQAQGDQLRRTLAERRQRHYRALLGAAEESAARRLREKEAEVEKAARRGAELEERVAQLRVETQLWQARARAQEATAASLQAQLQQAMMMAGGSAHDKRDELTYGGGELPADDAESAHVDPVRVVSAAPSCRACLKRPATLVLLPCRHLSLCRGCHTTVDVCPVCHTSRSSSVEVFLS